MASSLSSSAREGLSLAGSYRCTFEYATLRYGCSWPPCRGTPLESTRLGWGKSSSTELESKKDSFAPMLGRGIACI